MKLPDEFIDELAMKAWPKDEWIGVQYIKFARAVEQAAYRAGQEEMRERAAKHLIDQAQDADMEWSAAAKDCADYIRALPVD